MNVYAGAFFRKGKQVVGVMAGTKKQVAQATGCSLYYIQGYWSMTGNTQDVEIATKSPGVLFWRENSYSSKRNYERADELSDYQMEAREARLHPEEQ